MNAAECIQAGSGYNLGERNSNILEPLQFGIFRSHRRKPRYVDYKGTPMTFHKQVSQLSVHALLEDVYWKLDSKNLRFWNKAITACMRVLISD